METKTILVGAFVGMYVVTHVVADKDLPRNTKPITFLASVTANSSLTMVSGGTSNMMSSEDKSFSTRQVEGQYKLTDKA
jgi:hypothetical protein